MGAVTQKDSRDEVDKFCKENKENDSYCWFHYYGNENFLSRAV